MTLNNPPAGTLRTKIITATRAMDAATGSVAYTGVGFVPRAVMAMGAGPGANGFSVGGADQGALEGCVYNEEAAGLVNVSTALLIRIFETIGGGGKAQSASLTSMDTDGFTLAWTRLGVTAAGTANLVFLCFN